MGAWIETARCPFIIISILSRPTWARGLKRNQLMFYGKVTKSRPTWARGLKLHFLNVITFCLRSRPTWARGLKQAAGIKAIGATKGRAPRGRVD